MMGKVKVNITNKQKAVKLPTGLRLVLRRSCSAVLSNENFEKDAEVNITIVDNGEIHQLNKEFRNIDRPTDVLSFPLGENGEYDVNPETGNVLLGDIVISVEKAVEQAIEYNHRFQREMSFLTVHSMLHLLGYDHETTPKDKMIMREKEEQAMTLMGLTRETSFKEEDLL